MNAFSSIGQIQVRGLDGGHELRHRQDAARAEGELSLHTDPEDAAALAVYDDNGVYRPLKTAPNLRRGWRLVVPDDAGLRLALDLFYPARMGAWRAFQVGRLEVTPFRETLGRQTGMYRVTQKITDDQSNSLVGHFCRSSGGCLRTILWRRDAAGTAASDRLPAAKFDPAVDQVTGERGGEGFVPLLCQEACNLIVSMARVIVKGERPMPEEAGDKRPEADGRGT